MHRLLMLLALVLPGLGGPRAGSARPGRPRPIGRAEPGSRTTRPAWSPTARGSWCSCRAPTRRRRWARPRPRRCWPISLPRPRRSRPPSGRPGRSSRAGDTSSCSGGTGSPAPRSPDPEPAARLPPDADGLEPGGAPGGGLSGRRTGMGQFGVRDLVVGGVELAVATWRRPKATQHHGQVLLVEAEARRRTCPAWPRFVSTLRCSAVRRLRASATDRADLPSRLGHPSSRRPMPGRRSELSSGRSNVTGGVAHGWIPTGGRPEDLLGPHRPRRVRAPDDGVELAQGHGRWPGAEVDRLTPRRCRP